MDVIGKLERGAKTWIAFFFLFVYFFNGFWYSCHFVEQAARPSPYAKWWEEKEPYNVSLLNESWRLSNLVDRHDFRFVLNRDRCNDSRVFLLIFIHSAPSHGDRRRAIRRTWGRESNVNHETVRVVFLLGQVRDPELQRALELENAAYGDVVQGNFLDTYRNLTYKHVMGLKWVSHFCRHAKYVFKTDDDIFVDIFQMVNYLKGKFGVAPPRNLMMCFLYRKAYVKRSRRSKWYVSIAEYRDSYYPPYCAGWGIVMSADVVFNLYVESSTIPYFWVDDVVVSGILAQKIGIQHVELNNKIPVSPSAIERWISSPDVEQPYLFGMPETDMATIHKLWNKTLQYYNNMKR